MQDPPLEGGTVFVARGQGEPSCRPPTGRVTAGNVTRRPGCCMWRSFSSARSHWLRVVADRSLAESDLGRRWEKSAGKEEA